MERSGRGGGRDGEEGRATDRRIGGVGGDGVRTDGSNAQMMEGISPACHPSMAKPEVDLGRRVGMEGEGEV